MSINDNVKFCKSTNKEWKKYNKRLLVIIIF